MADFEFPNVEVGDKLIVKNEKTFMGDPMFDVGQEWIVVGVNRNYTHVKNGKQGYWIDEVTYFDVFK